MTDSEIISKIKKVLALATNNSCVEEGRTAMLLAQKMMIENNISISEISERIESKEVINQSVEESVRSSWWHKQLAVIISKNFRCETYISKRRNVSKIMFIGLKNDHEIAKQIYIYAIKIISKNCKEYILQNSKNLSTKKGMKNQYIIGYLDGLKDKFAEQIKNNSWGLIIVKDPMVDNIFKDLNIKHGKRHSFCINGNEQDRNNGYRDGKNFQMISGELT